MILNNTPENQAILSNVGEIGEFRIRNSAKAFNILSSGLYANKIKAIVRELSCNAVDSHIAAGKADVPFEVHLPTSLEPHFSIRDFGTGLNHDQVTNIYTTYFESTKTASNEFIGALGLGSKSPFSYTDNFTVTAIKDGVKGIYSAFINGEGVPSIAKMMDEPTDEPAGVEIKFSVNDRFDFQKFKEEAASVYKYFKLRPTMTGNKVDIPNIEYETKDVIPGVHVRADAGHYRRSNSIAVMGNIAYPIDVPNPEQLGALRTMLECGLEIHFAIGDVDFQASREGLSYIPQTVDAIKKKLEALNAALAVHIKTEADAIGNLWDRAIFLSKKREHPLWTNAVNKYAIDSKLETVDATNNRYRFLKEFRVTVDELASVYNITVRAFNRSRGSSTCGNEKVSHDHARDAQGNYITTAYWSFAVSENLDFVVNDTKVGCGERAKYHYRQANLKHYSQHVYVLDKFDATKDMKLAEFFSSIKNPPSERVIPASSLLEKPRKDSSVGRNVSILGMETRRRSYGNEYIVWVDAGKLDSFDANKTHYYVPLSGYVVQGKVEDAKTLREWLKTCGMARYSNIVIYGVRKTDLDEVKKRPNWVNIEEHIEKTIGVPDEAVIMTVALQEMKLFSFMGDRYSHSLKFDHSLVKNGSPFKEFVKKYDNYKRVEFSEHAMKMLYSAYGSKINFDMPTAVKKHVDEFVNVTKRYPLLDNIERGAAPSAVAEYVNMIDNLKGI